MALQIRRGLEADRTSFTPNEGELLYVTDTGSVYIGDGTTAGGTLVTGDVVNDTSPSLGGDLNLNSNDIVGTGNINITGTITATGNINLGDESTDSISVVGSLTTNLTPALDSNVDIGTNSLRWRNGYFTGLKVDGQIDAIAVNSRLVADDSTISFDPTSGVFDGTFIGNVTGNVTGTLDGDVTGNVTGNVTGTLDGDVTGSVFGDDSSVIVDGLAGEVVGKVRTTETLELNVAVSTLIRGTGLSQPGAIGPQLVFRSSTGTIEAPTTVVGGTTGDALGEFQGLGYDGSDYQTSGILRIATDLDTTVAPGVVPGRVMMITANSSGNLVNLLVFNSEGKLGIGTPRPDEKLHVNNGNAKIDGFVQFGSLTSTERDALTAANGMVIYNSTNDRFEGRQAGAWINLDDGTAATP